MPRMKLRIREVDDSAGQPLRQAQGPGSCMVSELVEMADISWTRVKDTDWVITAKDGTPHTRS